MRDQYIVYVIECDHVAESRCMVTIEITAGAAELEEDAEGLGWQVIRYAQSEMNEHYCPEHRKTK